jgi:transposase
MARLRNKHCTRLHALLLELEPGGIASEITVTKANTLLNAVIVDDQVTRHRVMIANELVDDIARLDALLKASKKRIEIAVVASGTTLTDIVGVGPICAAIIIGSASHPEQPALRISHSRTRTPTLRPSIKRVDFDAPRTLDETAP